MRWLNLPRHFRARFASAPRDNALAVQVVVIVSRACWNVLTEGLHLGELIGKSIRVGQVELEIGGETDPCDLMDHFHQGIQDALRTEFRGGIYGRVVKGGRIQVGDSIALIV